MKILIVEDMFPFQDAIEMCIQDLLSNTEITKALSEKQALEAINNEIFDLIILDGKLEHPMHTKGHGRNVLAKLSDEQKKITIINSADVDFVFEGKNNGTLYLSNKNNEEDLTEIVKKLFSL
ncbi:MAG: response regulator [Candidatus Pacebacteria bacterium]|jgi:response regulator of citrate/malate metabolism|nr:response regulator [Candidatus Paceibacterota bacterium]MBP9701275.1 response regulator [Candidatus Paceibacterota bacterium]